MNARPQAWLDQAINDLEMARLAVLVQVESWDSH